ncbi:Hypothetical predicted protein [Mytilus galloprovincialis]|uniref:DZIP3-like HEPN domain-containing protein n=1 Tax=Mytilus galloprovincialis TaxID=29158 RepID=A0A8B6FW27_MYTGA|nr:Hypothetical predicted protein [Mytilus galloprovincialis]
MSDNIYSTTKESSNYARLCRLLLDVGTDVFRYVFDNFAPPADLFIFLSKHEAKLKKKPNLREYQKKKLYPDNGKPLSNDFDISLLYTLLRETCNLEPPMNGWGNKVDPSDNSISANIEKIRQIRNDIYGHVLRACLHEYIFEENWLVLSKALISLGGQRYEQIIYRLRYVSLDPNSDEDYMRRFSDWVSEGSKRLDAVEESVANILNIVTSMAKPDEQDQLKLIIEFRAKEDRCFVETRAFLDIENQLIRNGSVLIVGDPGEGKTFSAWHIILKSLIKGFQFHLVDSPHEWQSKWTPTSKQIFFVDDCFGKSQLVPEVEAQNSLYRKTHTCIDDKGLSVQYWAARTGNKILLKFFLDEQDPTIDVLHGACYSESIDCVHMVLNHKVNTNATDNSGFTPLLISCVTKNRDITRLLLSRGADVNKEHADFGTVLHYACWNMDLDLVTILLQKGAKSNVVTTAGWPNVVFDGNGNDIIRMLIKREKTLRLTSNTNWSPLHLACGKNNIEIVNLLIQYGANINQYTTQGWTPLFCATKKGLHHIVTILIKKGAFVNMKDHFGVACIHRVCYDGYLHVARALLSAKADVNIQSKALYTPLHCACENGHEDLVHLLLKYGADTRLCSMSNKTPRDVAVKKQRFDIISVIEQHEQRC